MPRRNRNAGTPRPDTDQLAADLAQLAFELHDIARTRTGASGPAARHLATAVKTASLVVVTDGKQPTRQLVLQSR
jgi:hypothetical protein